MVSVCVCVCLDGVGVCVCLDGVGVASERQRPSVHRALCQVRAVKPVYDDERLVGELRGRRADHQVTSPRRRTTLSAAFTCCGHVDPGPTPTRRRPPTGPSIHTSATCTSYRIQASSTDEYDFATFDMLPFIPLHFLYTHF